jgi:hypothetical protein
MAGRQGFEPRFYGPEPYVLPLDDLPVRRANLNRREYRPAQIEHEYNTPQFYVKLGGKCDCGQLPPELVENKRLSFDCYGRPGGGHLIAKSHRFAPAHQQTPGAVPRPRTGQANGRRERDHRYRFSLFSDDCARAAVEKYDFVGGIHDAKPDASFVSEADQRRQ